MKNRVITTLFLDIGGVLLTNGWGKEQRNNAIKHFKLDSDEMNERHHLTFDTYEEGKLTLTEYLERVVFYTKRKFSQAEFIKFMMEQSIAFPECIKYFMQLKNRNELKIIAVSNEGREINAYRIKEFKLDELFDTFVSSSYVHLRKPDADIFQMAIDVSNTTPKHSIYIDDRLMFVQVARKLGMNGVHHENLNSTQKELKKYGLSI
jgi:putative hydrolase of the HAD superfamily